MNYPFVSCLEPQRIKNKYTGEEMVVACKHCIACEQLRNFKYSNLCDFESLTAKKTVFLTLTFDDKFVPQFRFYKVGDDEYIMRDADTGEYLGRTLMTPQLMNEYQKRVNYRINYKGRFPYLSKRELQLFMKRLRKYLDKYEGQKIRFFATGEYGPLSFRPHFHILLFVDDPSLFLPSVHTLGEYPYPYWSKYQKAHCGKGTLLSKLEYYIRESWPFGGIDAQSVEQGSCSSYVAGYVNSSVPLPSCLKVDAVKSFSQHSRFLGRKIFGTELIPLLKLKFTEFVQRSFFCRGRYDDFRTPSEMLHSVYPQCKGFALLSHEQRFRVYTVWSRLRYYFNSDKKADVARSLVTSFYSWLDTGLLRVPERVREDFLLIYTELSQNLNYKRIDRFDYDKFRHDDDLNNQLFQCVYSILLCSSVFEYNAKLWKSYLCSLSLMWCDFDRNELFLRKVERFWKNYEYLNLVDWYRKQEIYFDKSYSRKSDFLDGKERLSGDIKYFYNNVPYDVEQFKKRTFAYKAYSANVRFMARQRMKHKEQNDKNMIFETNI